MNGLWRVSVNNWKHAAVFFSIVGVLWAVGKPHAEEMIRQTVDERIGKIEKKQQEINERSIRQSADLEAVKDLSRETRDTMQLILQRLPRDR